MSGFHYSCGTSLRFNELLVVNNRTLSRMKVRTAFSGGGRASTVPGGWGLPHVWTP